MNRFKAPRFQFVEVPFGATPGTTITFPDQPSLRKAIVKAIRTYTVSQQLISPISGKTTISMADAEQCNIDFFIGNVQQAFHIPYLDLNNIQSSFLDVANTLYRITPNAPDLFETFDWKLTWDKCLVNFNTTPTANNAALLGVYYVLPGDIDPDNGMVVQDW